MEENWVKDLMLAEAIKEKLEWEKNNNNKTEVKKEDSAKKEIKDDEGR